MRGWPGMALRRFQKEMEKLQRICRKLIALMGIVIFGYLTFFAWTSSGRIHADSEIVAWSRDRIWGNLLFTAVVLLCAAGAGALADRAGKRTQRAWVLADRMSERLLRAAATAFSLAVAVCCGILAGAAHSCPTADQIYVYEAAENFFTGDYTNIQTEWYFNACPYQLGLGLLYGIWMRICGREGYLILQYAQAVCAGVTVYASFEVAWELFQSKRAALTSLFCTIFFVPLYLYTLYLYGESFGVCFAMLGVLFWLKANNGRIRKRRQTALLWALSGLCLALCYTARLALAIVLIALVLTGLFKALSDPHSHGGGRWRCSALTLLLIFLVLGSQKLAVAYMEKQAGVELADGMPAVLTVAMGIQDEAENENGTGPGSYNAYNLWLYFECGFDGESASSAAFLNIKQSLYRWLKNPGYMLDYMNQKLLNQWNEATYGGFFMTARQQDPEKWVQELYTGMAGDWWYGFLDWYQGMLYCMLLIWFAALFRKEGNASWCLPALLLVGEFCFSMIWEAKSRYVYPYIVMAIPCAAWSLTYCAGKIRGGMRKVTGRYGNEIY